MQLQHLLFTMWKLGSLGTVNGLLDLHQRKRSTCLISHNALANGFSLRQQIEINLASLDYCMRLNWTNFWQISLPLGKERSVKVRHQLSSWNHLLPHRTNLFFFYDLQTISLAGSMLCTWCNSLLHHEKMGTSLIPFVSSLFASSVAHSYISWLPPEIINSSEKRLENQNKHWKAGCFCAEMGLSCVQNSWTWHVWELFVQCGVWILGA